MMRMELDCVGRNVENSRVQHLVKWWPNLSLYASVLLHQYLCLFWPWHAREVCCKWKVWLRITQIALIHNGTASLLLLFTLLWFRTTAGAVMIYILQSLCRLVFPTNLLIYFCGTIFVLCKSPPHAHTQRKMLIHYKYLIGVTLLVGFIDNTKLFCGSRDLIYAFGLGNETTFCIISG